MKRVWIVAALILCIIGSGVFSLVHLKKVTDEMLVSLDIIAQELDRATGGNGNVPSPEGTGDPLDSAPGEKKGHGTNVQEQNELTKLAHNFQQQWEKDEIVIMHYIHHDELDEITGTVARLQALARYNAVPEFAAEVDRLRHLVLHIYESQLPNLVNIL